jgi:ribonuclease VapC
LLDRLGVVTEPVDAAQAGAALAAWRRFGKGRHPAGLNLGDCFSYALARMSGGSLLFKGNDFAQTDIAGAL